jgi:hypothetical protein
MTIATSMIRPLKRPLALALVLVLSTSAANAKGVFASHAVNLWSEVAGGGRTTVTSPDGRSRVVVQYDDDRGMMIRTEGAIGKLSFSTDAFVASELTWAPDSMAFFITGSDGGAVGDYHLLVVDRFGGHLAMKEATKAIHAAFGHPVKCDVPEAPNVGGIKWLPGHHVLVAAEVLPHSVCDGMGTFKAYELDPATMTVGRAYGQLEAKKLFGPDLGQELTAADDGCVKQPTSCYVSTNHPELKRP